MEELYRALDIREMQLLETLLNHKFPGHHELREQLGSVVGRTIDEDGGLSLQCNVGNRAPVLCRVPIEGRCADVDGVQIRVLLHVVDGFMNELEIYKDDSSRVKRSPMARNLVIVDPRSVPVIDLTRYSRKRQEKRGWPTLAPFARVGFRYAGSSDSYAAGRCLNSAFGH